MAHSKAARKRQRERRREKLKGQKRPHKAAGVKIKKRKNRKRKGRVGGSTFPIHNAPRHNSAGMIVKNLGPYHKMRGIGVNTDGISTAKTVHNGSAVEYHFPMRREKVMNLTASVVFNQGNMVINPGNSALFPWFATIAANFEQYRCEYLVFSYETEAYTASGTNVSAGKVIFATQYDVSPSAVITMNDDHQMENYVNSDKGAPFCELIHDVLAGDPKRKNDPMKNYYTFYGDNVAGQTNDTPKMFDIGQFVYATSGQPNATAEIGEIYVTYKFVMLRPREIPSSEAVLLKSAHAEESAAASATAAAPFGTGTAGPQFVSNVNTPIGTSTWGGGVLNSWNDVAFFNGQTWPTNIIFPSIGTYLIAATWFGATISTMPSIAFPTSNIVGVNGITDDTNNNFALVNAANTGSSIVAVINVVTSIAGNITSSALFNTNAITFGGNATMTGGKCDLYVCQLPNMLGSIPILEHIVANGAVRRARARQMFNNNNPEARLRFLEERVGRLLKDKDDDDYDRPVSASSSSSSSSVCSLPPIRRKSILGLI